MDKTYYKQKQILARVDKKGKQTGEIEKWDAHKKGLLHRGYAGILIYKNYILLQHRKHPAFDGVMDLSFASHQLITNDKLTDNEISFFEDLKREWNLTKKDVIGKVKNLGYVYYKEKDPKSIFTEHEYCDVLICKISRLPKPNLEFAYGYSLVTKDELFNKKSRIYENLSPWGKKIVDKKMI